MDGKKISRIASVVLIGLLSITLGNTNVCAGDGASSENEVNTAQNFAKPLTRFDVGGKSNRADIHELSIKPLANVNVPDSSGPWFVTCAPDIRVNWEDNNSWHGPFNVTVGKMLGKKTVVSVIL